VCETYLQHHDFVCNINTKYLQHSHKTSGHTGNLSLQHAANLGKREAALVERKMRAIGGSSPALYSCDLCCGEQRWLVRLAATRSWPSAELVQCAAAPELSRPP
jgi:hypothetical protein